MVTGVQTCALPILHTHGYRMDWLDQVIAAVQAENPDEYVDAELAAIEEVAA